MSSSVIEQIRDQLVEGAQRYEVRRRRARAAAVAALLVVVVAAGSIVWSAGNDDESKLSVQRNTTSTTRVVGPLTPGPLPGLEQLPPPPGTGVLPSAPVWTGREFLFVGITVGDGPLITLSFDADTRAWHDIARPPSTIGRSGATVWTGRELIICCGGAPEGSGAAAYDPDTDKWRVLPDPPVHGYTTAIWTGTAVIVVAAGGVASFDPVRGTWTMLPSPSELASYNKAVWTGHDLIVWPAPGSRSVHSGEMFDPVTNMWATLPAPPEPSWPAIPDIAWLDGSLVVIGGRPANTLGSERMVGARYTPLTNTWAPLADPLPEPKPGEGNLGSQVTLWTGTDLLMFAGDLASGLSVDGALLAYDPVHDSWRLVGDSKATALRPLVMAGDRVLLERDRSYYLSSPGWSPAGERANPRGAPVCPDAQHAWQRTSSSFDASGDGLPASGFATRPRAEKELRDRGAAIYAQYGATGAGVDVENGRAFKNVGGVIEIVEEPIAVIVVALPDASKCPAAPAFSNGVPLTFLVRPSG